MGAKMIRNLLILMLLMGFLLVGCTSGNSSKIISNRNTIEDNMFNDDGVLLASRDGITYLVNKSGQEIVNYEYIDNKYSKDLLCFRQDDKYGFINIKGEVVVAPIYDSLIPAFFEDLAAAEINRKWGFIGTDGQLKIMPKYDYAELFIDGLASVELDGKYGFIDKEGNMVIEPISNYNTIFVRDNAIVNIDSSYSIMTKDGEFINDIDFDYYYTVSEEDNKYIIIELDNKYGVMEYDTGKTITYPMYDAIEYLYQGHFRVIIDDKVGIINNQGEMVIQPTYKQIRSIDDGIAVGVREDYLEVLLVDGTEMDIGKYESLYASNESLIIARKDGKVGCIDYDGNTVIDFEYDSIGFFSNGIAPARIENQFMLIDRKGKLVIDKLNTDEIDDFGFIDINGYVEGEILINRDAKWELIDKKGDIKFSYDYNIIPRNYLESFNMRMAANKYEQNIYYENSVLFTEDGYAIIEENDYYGLINKKGEVVLSPVYDEIIDLVDMEEIINRSGLF